MSSSNWDGTVKMHAFAIFLYVDYNVVVVVYSATKAGAEIGE